MGKRELVWEGGTYDLSLRIVRAGRDLILERMTHEDSLGVKCWKVERKVWDGSTDQESDPDVDFGTTRLETILICELVKLAAREVSRGISGHREMISQNRKDAERWIERKRPEIARGIYRLNGTLADQLQYGDDLVRQVVADLERLDSLFSPTSKPDAVAENVPLCVCGHSRPAHHVDCYGGADEACDCEIYKAAAPSEIA